MINKLKIHYLFTLLILGMALFTGCSKEGPVGPAGPAGPTGPAGNSGTLNVKTTILDVVWNTNGNTSYRAVVNEKNITQAIMDKGVVNVSMSTDKVKWIPMPYANSVIGFYLWYDIGSLTVTSVNLTTNPFDPQYLYKYIKISTIDGN